MKYEINNKLPSIKAGSIYLPINANFNNLKVIAYTRKNKENKNREKSRKKKNVPLGVGILTGNTVTFSVCLNIEWRCFDLSFGRVFVRFITKAVKHGP